VSVKAIVIPLLLIFAGGASATSPPAHQDAVHTITLPETKTELKPGPGKELAERYCSICHSPDYIVMQPPFSREKWGEIVAKMVKAFGAPIPKEVAEQITAYLGTAYGKQK
jgi:hypothetical protein